MSSLSTTVHHAVCYLTRPLITFYPPSTIISLQLVLEANLAALYAPTWSTGQPSRGSESRSMTLSPSCLPPRAVYTACLSAGVQWFEWMRCLGGREFELIVNPGCVSLRFGRKETVIVWANDHVHHAHQSLIALSSSSAERTAKTLAQQLLEEDTKEDDELLAMIADEVSAPTWAAPLIAQYPERPSSASSAHSSLSSNSSGGHSFSSAETFESRSSARCLQYAQKLRRDREETSRVYIDMSKNDVTAYDSGKVGVLTGGVMLGGGPKRAVRSSQAQAHQLHTLGRPAYINNHWRTVRV